MDYLWNFLDSVQKSAVYLVIKDLAVIDWIAVFFVLFGMLQGSRKGMIEMLARTLQILLIIIVTLSCYPMVSNYLISIIPALTRQMADPVVFIPCAVFVWILVAWCFNLLGRIFRVDVSSFLKLIGGVFFGVLYWALLLSFLVQMVLFIPKDTIQKAFTKRGSYSGQFLAKMAPSIQKFVIEPFIGTKKFAPKPVA